MKEKRESDSLDFHEQLRMSDLFCPSTNQVKNVCSRSDCKSQSAFFCQAEDCKYCSEEHLGCESIKIRDIGKLIERRTDNHRRAILQMLDIQKRYILKIQKQTKDFIQRYQWRCIPVQYQEIINRMFKKNKSKFQSLPEMRPREAKQLLEILRNKKQEDKDVIANELKKFEEEISEIVLNLKTLKEDFINSIENGMHLFKSSKIIKNSQHEKFIYDSFNRPQSFRLLYRASEHNYSAKEFHRCCDYNSHTFTLIQTQFGKIVAGYTPLTWESVQIHQNDTADYSKKSFLLSIDLKEKMILVKPEKAICRNQFSGPIFGGYFDADIVVSDICNKNNSACNFPSSYKCNKFDPNVQIDYTLFSGAPRGKGFKIVEYEVYKVIF